MKVVWLPRAEMRVIEIHEYLSAQSLSFADRWLDGLFVKTQGLEKFPLRGRTVPELGKRDIRELIYGNYRILYRLEKAWVAILTVRHARQLLRAINPF